MTSEFQRSDNGKQTILLVEDEALITLEILSMAKTLDQVSITSFSNSDSSLEFARKNRVDLLITDINIRGSMDGLELARQVLKQLTLPVLFITGYATRDVLPVLKRDFASHRCHLLVKPIEEKKFRSIILHLLSPSIPEP